LKTITIISLITSSAFILGCQPDSSSKEPTFIIDASSAEELAGMTYSLTDNIATDFSSIRSLSAQNSNTRDLYNRASESLTYNCDTSGSMTLSVTVPDSVVSTEEMPENGSISVTSTFNNCIEYGETNNGSFAINMSWSGYDGTDFTSLTSTIDFSDYEYSDSEETTEIDGDITAIIASDEISVRWDMTMSSSEIGGSRIHTYTTTDVTSGLSDINPSAGVWRVDGGEDTYFQGTVVPNGIEVVVNGGQAELILWSEL
jgi:hypothetical protein